MSIEDILDILLEDDAYGALKGFYQTKYGENTDVMSAIIIDDKVEIFLRTYRVILTQGGNLNGNWTNRKEDNVELVRELMPLDEFERLVTLEGVMG